MSQSEKMWKCSVCGYVHYGDSPPDACPVCGATSDLFELEEAEDPEPQRQPLSDQWRCMNCEYVHKGVHPPEQCPVCGISSESFEALNDVVSTDRLALPETRILVIGGGIAGFSAAEAARKENHKAIITILTKEKYHPYYRLNLTRFLAGEISDEGLPIKRPDWYDRNNIKIELECPVKSIIPEKQLAIASSGAQYSYDKLIIAMGSHPFIPPFPGANRENVMTLRTRDDAKKILDICGSGGSVVVIGGGLLGLEAAGALADRGISVSLIEGFGWLLPRQLNEKAGRILQSYVQSKKINLINKGSVKELAGDECVRAVVLEDGRSIQADLVIISTGVRSNSYLGRIAGLDVNRGIVVNNYLETSEPHIYAVGDVAEHRGVCYGTWGPSQFQGTIAGMNAAGLRSEFAGIPRSNMLKVLGYDLFSIGQIRAEDASMKELEYLRGEEYYAFFLLDGCLAGAILMGNTELSASVKKIIESREACQTLNNEELNGESLYRWIESHNRKA